jgi:uncharacterized protein (TIGR02246 family)
MNKDEQAIRDLVDRWWVASRKNDVDAVLPMIADDALFTVAGAKPFGKKEFETQARKMKDVRTDGNTEVLEVEVMGNRAWMRGYITVRMNDMERQGYVLSILRKEPDGNWVIYREANLLPGPDIKGDKAGAKATAGQVPRGEAELHGVDDM